LPPPFAPGVHAAFKDGDQLSVDIDSGVVKNLTSGKTPTAEALRPNIQHTLKSGGLVEVTKEKLAEQAAAWPPDPSNFEFEATNEVFHLVERSIHPRLIGHASIIEELPMELVRKHAQPVPEVLPANFLQELLPGEVGPRSGFGYAAMPSHRSTGGLQGGQPGLFRRVADVAHVLGSIPAQGLLSCYLKEGEGHIVQGGGVRRDSHRPARWPAVK
jgi:hypothetical protein